MTAEEIERLVEEAEQRAEEDREVRERTEARLTLDNDVYALRSQLGDKDKLGAIPDDEKATVQAAVKDAIDFMDANPEAGKAELDAARQALQQAAGPIVQRHQRQRGSTAGGTGSDAAHEDDADDM